MALLFNDKVISGSVTGSSITFTHPLPHRTGYAVQVKYSGTTITGEIKLQASLNNSDFVDIGTPFTISDNSGCILFDNDGTNYNYLKIVCTSTTGDIMFEAWMAIKRPKPTE